MKFCDEGSYSPRGGFSKRKVVRESSLSEKELLELLCHEINGLVSNSKLFENQYRMLLNYYHGLARMCIS